MVERFLLNNVPTIWLGVGIVVVAVGTSLLGLALVRRSVELDRLRSQHDVAGFLIAVLGVLYAVLLAFMVVVMWQGFVSADDNVNNEANSLGNLYRDAIALGPGGRTLAKAVDTYATRVAYVEWPYMAAHQEGDPQINRNLNAMWSAVRRLPASTGAERDFVTRANQDLSTATQARDTRIEDTSRTLPTTLWIVLLVGGALTVGFTYFFGVERFGTQAIMVSTLAVMIALSLFVLLGFELPFSGAVSIKPTALTNEIAHFCSYNFVNPEAGGSCTGAAAPGVSSLPRRPPLRLALAVWPI